MSDHVLRVQSVLTPRDHLLLGWLYDHGVLTSFQIANALFPSLDFAQRRLARLLGWAVVDRFRPLRHGGGSFPYHYVIDQLGAEVVAAQRGDPPPRPDHARRRRRRWTASQHLAHRLGVNGFFTDLAGYARTHPGHALTRWWPEAACRRTGAFAGPDDPPTVKALQANIHPDGHGIWRTPTTVVPFFLEMDLGTELASTLIGKLAGYERMALRGGPAWPVLFSLHSTIRERHLHEILADTRLPIPVATTARDHISAEGLSPAQPVWWLHGHHQLLSLADLPGTDPNDGSAGDDPNWDEEADQP